MHQTGGQSFQGRQGLPESFDSILAVNALGGYVLPFCHDVRKLLLPAQQPYDFSDQGKLETNEVSRWPNMLFLEETIAQEVDKGAVSVVAMWKCMFGNTVTTAGVVAVCFKDLFQSLACGQCCCAGLPVQGVDEVLLKTPLHAVDKEMHDRLGDGILQVLAHYIKVRLHKQSGDLHLYLFLLTDAPWNSQYLHIHSPNHIAFCCCTFKSLHPSGYTVWCKSH